MNAPLGSRTYRAVFISDLHLGTRGCRSDFLLDFLRRTECRQLYLVGDVVDGWRLRRSWYWLPLRDLLTAAVWCAAGLGGNVSWRGRRFALREGGRLQQLVPPRP